MHKTDILGFSFDTYTRVEALEKLLSFLNEEKNHILITPNPEIVLEARRNKKLGAILKKTDLLVPDGIGVVWASKFNRIKIKERVAGYDLLQSLFAEIKDDNRKVYFLGGAPNVARDAKINMEKKYEGLEIVGFHNGYFDDEEELKIIEEIKNLKPDILVLGLGCPKQEIFAYKYKYTIPTKLICCLGGSLDVMAGKAKRAPDIFIKLNLEWFYRLLKQPSRFFRMLNLPLFMLIVLKEKIFGGLNCGRN